MTATDILSETVRPTWHDTGRHSSTLFAVVGFDGSAPARAALNAAADMIRGRNGHLEVVYVAHLPACVSLSAPAIVGMRQSFDSIARDLDFATRSALDDREPSWHFQRRNGQIARELTAAASELRSRHGSDATIVTVVGASAHLGHRIAGSVATALTREAKFPVLAVTT